MMHNKKAVLLRMFILWFLHHLTISSIAQQDEYTDKTIDRLIAFAKLAGSIEYFSPTDAVHNAYLGFGWSHIYIHGARLAEEVSDERAYADSLVSMFKPLEPSLYLSYDDQALSSSPALKKAPLVISSQHIGLDLHNGDRPAFRSIRTNRRSLFSDSKISEAPLMNIRLPDNSAGLEFKVDMFYTTDEPKNLKVFQGDNQLLEQRLSSNDTIFSIVGTINKNEKVLSVILAFDEFSDFSLRFDSLINIGNKKYLISDLLDTITAKENLYNLEITGNDLLLYPDRNVIGDTLNITLSKKMRASFPLAVYGDENNTYPLSSYTAERYPYNKGAYVGYREHKQLERMDVKLSNAIQIWNVLRFSHVYNPYSPKEEEELFRKTLRSILATQTIEDYEEVMWKMLSTYGDDAHIHFIIGGFNDRYAYSAPISIYYIKGRYYVSKIHDKMLQGKVAHGDELLTIDGETVSELEKKHIFSRAARMEYKKVFFMHHILYGMKDSEITMEFATPQGKVTSISTSRSFLQKRRFYNTSILPHTANRMVSSDTYYFNLTCGNLTDTLLNFIDDSTKNIIFDLRGYLSKSSEEQKLIEKLMMDTITTGSLFAYHILSPEKRWFKPIHQKYIPESSKTKANFYFLIDESAISASETFLDIIKYGKIGKLIGQPTAGSNGDFNYLYLPGDITVSFSGIKVLNSDGSKHIGRGVIPDHLVDFSREDLLNDRDPFVDRALELIEQKKDIN